MAGKPKKKRVGPIYTIALVFLAYSLLIHPVSSLGHLLGAGVLAGLGYGICRLVGFFSDKKKDAAEAEPETETAPPRQTQTIRRGRVEVPRTAAQETVARQKQERERQEQERMERERQEEERRKEQEKPKYPPEVQAIVDEGQKAHFELARLYASIPDLKVKRKVQKIIEISDKIIADAVEDPADVPQIKKFLDYYLPTTIKLLNAYDRMGAQGVEGANITGTMQSIDEMLDTAIDAYQKLLDSLFADQALDVETDIQVMNTLLKREGFIHGGGSAFQTEEK